MNLGSIGTVIVASASTLHCFAGNQLFSCGSLYFPCIHPTFASERSLPFHKAVYALLDTRVTNSAENALFLSLSALFSCYYGWETVIQQQELQMLYGILT